MLSVLLSLQGTAYHIRVSAYNMKGWGPPQASTPPFAIPSSEYPWEHSHRSQPRAGGDRTAPCAIQGSLSLLGCERAKPGAQAGFGVSGQAERLCLGLWDAASSLQGLCQIVIFQS